jgi:RNA polymerase sigma factor (sigma-70 family)
MTHQTLQAVLRSAVLPPADDAALLERFIAERDEQAFAGVVERHGRLVWAVCRHLTHCDADADDAFQATFLVLMQNAAKVRDAGRLSAWLHGTAYRICSKARLAAKRRARRESATAKPERNGSAVPDSAWDRALATVHEEVARLPDALRIPFILCCLEGLGTTEAARRLGWKLGTFSSRLTRAKGAIAARLERRGIALGLAATVGLATVPRVPAAVMNRAASWLQEGVLVPESILKLTQGVFAMSVSPIKLLAAMLLLACGLGFGGGSRNAADAQQPVSAAPAQDPSKYDEAVRSYLRSRTGKEGAVASTAKWDYDFVVVSDMGPKKFVEFLQDRETRGWEFNGQSTLLHDGKPAGHWVFRRPKAKEEAARDQERKALADYLSERVAEKNLPAGEQTSRNIPAKGETQKDLATLFDLLESGAAKRFGNGPLKATYDPRGAGSIHLEGKKEAPSGAG